MKKFIFYFILLFAFIIVLTGCGKGDQERGKEKENVKEEVTLTIAAAASLNDALSEIQKNYEKEHPNVKLVYNFGGSGTLQQQILQGAPIDMFFSAALDKFDELKEKGLLVEKNTSKLLGNELVLITGKDETAINGLSDLKKADKIAIGTPETVPAGQYAKQSLENIEMWKDLIEQDKIIQAKDVRSVLTYVESGNVDAGFVYKTDALTSDKVKIVEATKEDSHDPIIYPLGVIEESKHKEEAVSFFKYLKSDKAIQVFEKYGFKGLE